MAEVRYSICATHYNNYEHIEESAGVFATEIEGNPEWELVITDAGSDDGSLDYLRGLEKEQSNVRIVIEEGTNIGEGRKLAADIADGEILVQVMDLDASYFDDGRLLRTAKFYESLIAEEGDLMLSAGVNFCTKRLLAELGGWSELPANEETELKRRALRKDKLRFCPIRMFDRNEGLEKGLIPGVNRFYANALAKFNAGVGFWHMLMYWLRNAPGLKPRIGAVIIFPFAWFKSRGDPVRIENSYDYDDPYVLDFKQTVYRLRPELWIEPPPDLRPYVDRTEVVFD